MSCHQYEVREREIVRDFFEKSIAIIDKARKQMREENPELFKPLPIGEKV